MTEKNNNSLPLSDLSYDFCKKLTEGSVVAVVAQKHGGKTTMILALLREVIMRQTFQKIVLCLENYLVEADDSYHFILDLFNKHGKKSGQELVIFDKFDPLISTMIREERLRTFKEHKKMLLWIDDATAFSSKFMWANDDTVALFCNNRHPPLSIIICLHSLRGVMHPILRQNVSYFLFGHVSSEKLLNQIWEEYFGILCKYNDFKKLFIDSMKKEFSFITIDTTNKKIVTEILSWKFIAKNIKINELLKKKYFFFNVW